LRFFPGIVLTVLLFLTKIVLAILIFLTRIVLTVLTLLAKIVLTRSGRHTRRRRKATKWRRRRWQR
jgi:hypothetical protein